jgi:micrococcal nuclease
MLKGKDAGILAVLILILFAINYSFLDRQLVNFFNTEEEISVDRIIDGDTIESNSTSIRLLGINAPEKGDFYYNEAKEFLASEIFNKTVVLKFTNEKTDKYGRTLAYIFLDEININVKTVKQGYANYYFYSGKDEYSDELVDAWKECIKNRINLCRPSQNLCSQCINIGNSSNFIANTCSFNCNISGWTIKGEGREKFIFSGILNSNEEKEFSLDLTDSGGSIFLRDNNGGLVLWKEY